MYIYVYYCSTTLRGSRPPYCLSLEITLRHTKLGRTPLY